MGVVNKENMGTLEEPTEGRSPFGEIDTKCQTFSYDAHLIRLPNWNILGCSILDFLLQPLQSWTRGEGARAVYVISPTDKGYIWLTNPDSFWSDAKKFVNELWMKTRDIEAQETEDHPSGRFYRGIQFDVQCHCGTIFKTYTYVTGSVRSGGFDKYALK